MGIKGYAAVLAVLVTAACPQPSTRPDAQTLPSQPPPIHELTFTENGDGPPALQGRTNVQDVPWVELPGALTEARILVLREAASSDPRVRSALGERFAYVTADEVEPPKGADRSNDVRLTFYSHTNNAAIEVLMRGEQVVQVEPMQGRERYVVLELDGTFVERTRGYQPPEGEDEIRTAVSLAAQSPGLRDDVEGLEGSAIAISPAEGQPGAGHRVLYVTFSRAGEARALYFATVDLTDNRILAYGPVAER